MPQIFIALPVLVISIAHNWSRIPPAITVLINRSRDVRQVRRHDGHFVLGIFLLTDYVRVPVACECDVGIGLHVVVFTAIHSMSDMTFDLLI